MKRLIFFLVILFAAVFVGLKIAEDPGYVLFAYQHWTVEMPLWFAVSGFILILFGLYLLHHFFNSVDSSWTAWKVWLSMRRKHKAYNKTNRGLIELIEANWKTAENLFMEGVDQAEAPLINFLGAAKAAHERNAYDKQDVYLRKAYDISPQTHVAVGLIQAQFQLSQGKLEQALSTLNQLHHQAPKQKLVLKLLERVYVQLGDWKNLLKLIPILYKEKLITQEQMTLLEVKVYQELFVATVKVPTVNAVKDLWRTLSRTLQKNSTIVLSYVQQLSRFSEMQTEIEELIIAVLKHQWSPELVEKYGLLNTNPVKQLKIAEGWLKQYGPQSMLFLTLARLSISCKIWGKAKQYFESSLKTAPIPAAYIEYGNLLVQLGEQNNALQVYREGCRYLNNCYNLATI